MTLLSPEAIDKLAQDTSPELIPMLIETFLEELDKQRQKINEGIDTKAYDVVGDAAHSLKSTAGSYGAPMLNEQTAKLEAIVRAGQIELVDDLTQEVLKTLDLTEQAYREFLTTYS